MPDWHASCSGRSLLPPVAGLMKVAFAVLGDRISPVFDASRRVLVLEVAGGQVECEQREYLPDVDPRAKVAFLSCYGVEILVCGAISRSLKGLLTAYDIQVVPFVAGELREVIEAFLHGELPCPAFSMPGHVEPAAGSEEQRA